MTTSIGADQIIAKRKHYMFPCTSHFYKNPPQIVRGHMQYLYDDKDTPFVDFFAGVSVVACGHCNEHITRATIKQLETLQHTSTIYLTQPMVDLAEKMASILPGNLCRTFFCNSGSEANEGALLAARLHTGKRDFIALEYGLHGRTYLTMSVTGIPMWRTDPNLDPNVNFIPRPYDPNVSLEEAANRSIEALRKVLAEKGDSIAAMIVEPIQGNGGIIAPAKHYFQEVQALLKAHNVLLIADEIQTGFGRTGKMFAMEHYNVVPDIMSMAKALGNGTPIGCFSTTNEIANSFNKPSASTFGGNPVASVTAMAVLDYIENERLVHRSSKLGRVLFNGLKDLQQKYKWISDVRGMGLMVGVELFANDPEQGAAAVDKVIECMKNRGFIVGKNGIHRNVLAFQPPLVIHESNIRRMLSSLEDVCAGEESWSYALSTK
ncbi:aspartate aminotransferase family protein [Paenibacillus selenitireducens]|uniref:alanine--glyoxylate transaminase n=1 Tax=Paenibacillus selenitireducens TaxID=1324314 RepID=A0A1T2XAT6_9BACL|nr:aspartate aminotransferase family protein [Paenibacillus selenitireducens]OPA77011.1 aspartate aminotransferase family protein [Paenibacillus selenitireducens]